MPSVLFTATSTRARSLRRFSAIRRSAGTRPARPSTMNSTTSASAIACSAWRAISAKMPACTPGSSPPVSMAMKERSPWRPSP
jgi:hypothetical protein